MRMRIAATVVCLALLASACGEGGGASAPAPAAGGLERAAEDGRPELRLRTAGHHHRGRLPAAVARVDHPPARGLANDTDTPQSIVFDHLPVRSGVIPPGGTYTYTPDTVASITYHSGRRPTLEGKVQASWSSSDEAAANSGG